MDFSTDSREIAASLVAGSSHYDEIIESVLAAELSVWISTANLKELMVRRGGRRRWRSILERFTELHERGIELRILHASTPSRPFRETFDRLDGLRRGGLEMRLCPRVHFKTVIVDASLIYLGSANWTGAGLGAKGEGKRNFELGVMTRDEVVIDTVQEYYNQIWTGAACPRCKHRDICDEPLDSI